MHNKMGNMNMDEKTKNEFLKTHIPSRVRAVLARTNLLDKYLSPKSNSNVPLSSKSDPTRKKCDEEAVQQGRIAAIRWLIEFVTEPKHQKKYGE